MTAHMKYPVEFDSGAQNVFWTAHARENELSCFSFSSFYTSAADSSIFILFDPNFMFFHILSAYEIIFLGKFILKAPKLKNNNFKIAIC